MVDTRRSDLADAAAAETNVVLIVGRMDAASESISDLFLRTEVDRRRHYWTFRGEINGTV